MADFDKATTLIDRLRTLTTEYDFATGRVAQLTADISEVRAELTGALGLKGAIPLPPPSGNRRHKGETESAIVAAASNGPIRVKDLSHLFGTRGSAAAELSRLAKKGVLQRVGVGLYTTANNGAQV